MERRELTARLEANNREDAHELQRLADEAEHLRRRIHIRSLRLEQLYQEEQHPPQVYPSPGAVARLIASIRGITLMGGEKASDRQVAHETAILTESTQSGSR